MSSVKSFISGMLCILFLTTCNKRWTFPTESTYTFINKIKVPVNLDVYANEADYQTGANCIGHHVLPTDGKLSISFSVGELYWIDWYSDDYSYSNLTTFPGGIGPQLHVADAPDTWTLTAVVRDTIRSVLFNGNGFQTSWSGVIQNVANQPEVHQIVLRRDFTGEHTVSGANGTTTEAITYHFMGEHVWAGVPMDFGVYIQRRSDAKAILEADWVLGALLQLPILGRDTALVFTLDPLNGKMSDNYFPFSRN